ncbi:Alpha/Beta hydrolase protein [Mycena maculata]|uniref:Alpha/Beta hydrolase protein n=1 Tax=Mycena maculata TaxID=230809 RepID=A0AAD7K192_9AGAR|nr:Alpha/Beta hydrolase protein [Mycena maculata]
MSTWPFCKLVLALFLSDGIHPSSGVSSISCHHFGSRESLFSHRRRRLHVWYICLTGPRGVDNQTLTALTPQPFLSAAMSGRVVKSADGTDIYAEAVGHSSNPAVVFIHGFSMSSIAFDAIFSDPKWIANVYLVRYDVRGHGRSGRPTDEASWESKRLAQDFDAVVEDFTLKRPFVLGWSLGATFITDILSFKPHTYISGIIYVGALPYMGPTLAKVGSPACLVNLPPLTQTTNVDDYQAAAIAFVELGHASLPYTFYLACLGSSMIQHREITVRLLSRTQDPTGLLAAGRDAGLPMLAIHGAKDRIIVRDETLKAVEGWKNLTVVDIDDAEHFIWISQPERFREEVLKWVTSTTSFT